MVLTGSFVLSPETGLSCLRRPWIRSRAWRQRRGVRTTRLHRPRRRASSAHAIRVHRIPHQRIV